MSAPEQRQSHPSQQHPHHRLLRGAPLLEASCPSKGVLPLSALCYKVSPGQKLVIRSRSHVAGLHANRLLVADPQKWKISALRTGPRIGGCQVRGDHPALLNPGPGSPAKLPLLTMDRDVTLEVEYVGQETYDGEFIACLCLENDQQERDLRATQDQPKSGDPATLAFLAKSPPIVRGEQICLSLPMRAHDLHITDLILRVTEPAHWLVSDILIGEDTLLVDDGDLPGELLADRPGRVPLRLGRLRAKEELTLQATYIGPLVSAAASLSFEVFGSEVPAHKAANNAAFLPMSSNVAISGSVQIQAQIGIPTGYAFLPEEIILRDPEKWAVSDIRNSTSSQFAACGSIPGTLFGGRARECQPYFDAVLGGNTFLLIANYVGSNLEGETLVCGVVGRVVRLPPPVVAGTY